MEKLEAYVVAETKYYNAVDAKRRKGLFSKVTEGWISSEDTEDSRILFHYPLYLSEGQETESVYVNKEDINIKVIDGIAVSLQEASPENISYEEFEDAYYECHMTDKQLEEYEKHNLTEEEEEIYHNNIKKESTPIGGSYFDEPMEEKVPVSFVKKTVRLKPGVTYDYNNQKIGHLPNDYYLEVNDSLAIIRNKSNNQTYKVRRSNIIGY